VLLQLKPDEDLVIVNNQDDIDNLIRVSQTTSHSSHVNTFILHGNLIQSNDIDLESIAKKKHRHIFLLNFDKMSTELLKYLICSKSKKSEIIGVSLEHRNYFKNLQLDIQHFKDKGFTNNQIHVMIILKENCPSEMIEECLNSYRFKSSKIKIREIEYFDDVDQFIKG
jgi:hypothetical protein